MSRSGHRRFNESWRDRIGPASRSAAAAVQRRSTLRGTISACLIVKDEEQMLPGCLESLRDAVDEVVVVDTGSTDGTVELARRLGARVFSFPWTGDFAAARNYSLDHARGEWILVIDADERLRCNDGRRPDKGELLRLLASGGQDAYFIPLTNYDDEQEKLSLDRHMVLRLARKDPESRFRHRVHENLYLRPGAKAGQLPPGYELHHFGYIAEVVRSRGKIERNILLLKEELAHQPDSTPMQFYLAREYHRQGRFDLALEGYQRAWALLGDERPRFWGELAAFLGRMLLLNGRMSEAVAHCDAVLEAWPHFADLWLHRGQALRAQGRVQEALASLYKALATHETNDAIPLDQKVVPGMAWAEIGACYDQLGDAAKTAAAYRESLRAYPRLGGVADRLGRLLLAAGEPHAAVEACIVEAGGADEPLIVEGLWQVFCEARDWERALFWADRLVALAPGPRRLLNRATMLLYLGRGDECLRDAEAAAAGAEGEVAQEAAWVRSVALFALGRAAEAGEALSGLDAENRRVRAARRLVEATVGPAAGGAAGGWADAALVVGLWELAGQLASARAFEAFGRLMVIARELGRPAEEVERNGLAILAAHGHCPSGAESLASAV